MSTMESIQELIEHAAQRLHRSVAVDDAGLRLLASSTHFEDVDEARLSSLVGRRITGPLRDYVMGQGAQSRREPTVLPARPDLGMQWDRLCLPLRSRFELLGFLWIMASTPVDDDELRIARDTAERVQDLLARRARSADADLETESLVLALFHPEHSDRLHAARDMLDLGQLIGVRAFTCIVVATRPEVESSYGEPTPDVVRRALSSATAGLRAERFVLAVNGSESVVILGHREAVDTGTARSLAHAIHREIQRLDAGIATATVVGIGDERVGLESIVESRDQARIAVKIGHARHEPVVAWAEHSTDALLAAMLRPDVDSFLIPTPLRARLATQSAATMSVLETFLDHAGNAMATAGELGLHRTTVYYRIKRFQETTGLDLEDGATRLLLHLWLRTRAFIEP